MDINKKELEKFAEENGIKFIVLFGSRATETFKKESDFDIAVLASPEKNISDLDNYNNVLFGLAKILDIPDYKLDLTNLNKANILLRYEITLNGVLLRGDEDAYAQYKAFAFRDYIDAKPLFNLESLLVHKRLKLMQKALA